MVEKIQDSPCADKLHVLSVMLHNCCSSDLLPYLQSVASTLVQVSHDPRNIVIFTCSFYFMAMLWVIFK